MLVSSIGFAHSAYKGNVGQILDKNYRLELKIAIFVLVLQIMVFHFVYKKDF